MTVINKPKIICNMEESLNCGKKIFVYDSSDRKLLEIFREEIKRLDIKNVEIWHCMEGVAESVYFRQISSEEIKEVMKIYRMFDFSDKVIVLSESKQYGSMCNYVKNGILSSQEMADVLLCNV